MPYFSPAKRAPHAPLALLAKISRAIPPVSAAIRVPVSSARSAAADATVAAGPIHAVVVPTAVVDAPTAAAGPIAAVVPAVAHASNAVPVAARVTIVAVVPADTPDLRAVPSLFPKC
jgi:hypothetical protein